MQPYLLESLSICAIDLVVSVLSAHNWIGSPGSLWGGPAATERLGLNHPSASIDGDWCSLPDRSCRPASCADDPIIFLPATAFSRARASRVQKCGNHWQNVRKRGVSSFGRFAAVERIDAALSRRCRGLAVPRQDSPRRREEREDNRKTEVTKQNHERLENAFKKTGIIGETREKKGRATE
jgi:hypothetical protein